MTLDNSNKEIYYLLMQSVKIDFVRKEKVGFTLNMSLYLKYAFVFKDSLRIYKIF